uniref:Phosphatase and actin regulator n=1 Tax=Steinernema glaseri TaxID=37863 RepID=A0A1I8AV19_9BILA
MCSLTSQALRMEVRIPTVIPRSHPFACLTASFCTLLLLHARPSSCPKSSSRPSGRLEFRPKVQLAFSKANTFIILQSSEATEVGQISRWLAVSSSNGEKGAKKTRRSIRDRRLIVRALDDDLPRKPRRKVTTMTSPCVVPSTSAPLLATDSLSSVCSSAGGKRKGTKMKQSASASGIGSSSAKRARSPQERAFSASLRTSKFWLRILRPWKWRKRSRKAKNISRTASDHVLASGIQQPADVVRVLGDTVTPVDCAAIRPSTSSPLGLGCERRPEEDEQTTIADSDCFSLTVPSDAVRASPVRITTEEFSIPSVQRVVIVDADKENCAPSTSSSSFYPSPGSARPPSRGGAGEVWQASRVTVIEEPVASTSEPHLRESSVDPQPEILTANGMEYCRLRRAQAVEEVPVYEPDLSAQPAKSVLKRPGAPSRRFAPEGDDLPTRLTDDSDSEADIQYRDDDEENLIRRRRRMQMGSIGRSTNPAIASKLEPLPNSRRPSESSEDDEEVEISKSGLAARINRRDTLARKLDAPDPVDDIPNQTSDERRKIMHRVSIKLERKLSERPSAIELEQRNILKEEQAATISQRRMEDARKMLLRKLSFRPTVQQLKDKQIIKFNDYVEVTDAEIYDRKADKPWTRLTPSEKALIRKELNDFKSNEMDVHEESKIFTRFHRP